MRVTRPGGTGPCPMSVSSTPESTLLELQIIKYTACSCPPEDFRRFLGPPVTLHQLVARCVAAGQTWTCHGQETIGVSRSAALRSLAAPPPRSAVNLEEIYRDYRAKDDRWKHGDPSRIGSRSRTPLGSHCYHDGTLL